MAQQIIEYLTSDLSGDDIPADSNGGTVEFTVSGIPYAVDLTEAELETFNSVLQPYVDAAQQLSRSGAPVTRTRVASSGAGKRSKEQLAAIRTWAKKNGYIVSERGRVAAPVLEAFDAAH
ncbi:Lsr2 family protein [Nakamurella sp. A5-74]|uniref:Lsr2 family protein n=1 Tax=Nakamurella sp. A5-74 TaxID=3158264 RepID=A0AAU8DR27_9ACTN